jgi:hypothetical protein
MYTEIFDLKPTRCVLILAVVLVLGIKSIEKINDKNEDEDEAASG